jgi:hypothetical protein
MIGRLETGVHNALSPESNCEKGAWHLEKSSRLPDWLKAYFETGEAT